MAVIRQNVELRLVVFTQTKPIATQIVATSR